jgi:predicted RNase H-like HicB family nuclease
MDKRLNLTAVFEKAEEGGYIACIEEIPGVNTQGETISEAKENLYEALQMVLDVNREISQKDSLNKEVIKESFNFIY